MANTLAAARFRVVVLVCMALASMPFSAEVSAQQPTDPIVMVFPGEAYGIGQELYRRGELGAAFESFQTALSLRYSGRGRVDWLDAIPIQAMIGECYYQAGDLESALDRYDDAIRVVARYPEFARLCFRTGLLAPVVVQPNRLSAWAQSAVPDIVPTQPSMLAILGQDGVMLDRAGLARETRIELDVVEIARGLALASYRRRVILGSLSKDPAMGEQVFNLTERNLMARPDQVASSIRSAVRASLSYALVNDPSAMAECIRNVGASERVNSVSPIPMLILARLHLSQGQQADAYALSMRAAIASAALGQTELTVDAFLLAAGCLDASNAANLQRVAADAARTFAGRAMPAFVAASCAAAEAAVWNGDLTNAKLLCTQAAAAVSQRNTPQPRLAAHAAYVSSLVNAKSGVGVDQKSPTVVNASIGQMMAFANGSGVSLLRPAARNVPALATPRSFQYRRLIAQGRPQDPEDRAWHEIASQYMSPIDLASWRIDPVDSLVYEMTNRAALFNQWLSTIYQRNAAKEMAVAIDQVARQQFLQTQPLGGRLQHIRYLAATDVNQLSPAAARDLPAMGESFERIVQLKNREQPAPGTLQRALRDKNLESMATAVALERRVVPSVAPPAITSFDEFSRVPADTGMLLYMSTPERVVGVLVHKNSAVMWDAGVEDQIKSNLRKLLHQLGVFSHKSPAKRSASDEWKRSAHELRQRLIPDPQAEAISRLRRLIVVPSACLWYLPIELLPLGGFDSVCLGQSLSVQYSPTPGLALYPIAKPSDAFSCGIYPSLFFAPRDRELNQLFVSHVLDSIDAPLILSAALKGRSDGASNYVGESISTLAVLGLCQANPIDPLELSPAIYDSASRDSRLETWLRMGAKPPVNQLLFGYRSLGASEPLGDGRDLSMPLTAMHCAGVRNIVISRWPVGGESASVLVAELLQELPHVGVLPAWDRALGMLRAAELNPATEPLARTSFLEDAQQIGAHPLYWSSYLLSAPVP